MMWPFQARPSSVILDIGAGSKHFAKLLRFYNPSKRQLIFCGEPRWGKLQRPISSKQIRELIENKAKGIFNVVSRYSEFDFPDASLDMVICNAPMPLMPPRGIEAELLRTLKHGWIFFFACPLKLTPFQFPDGTFSLRFRGIFHDSGPIDLSHIPGYPAHLPSEIWPSRVMKYNIHEAWRRRNNPHYQNRMRNWYMYRHMELINGYQVWQKL